jgi:hypothetical protein
MVKKHFRIEIGRSCWLLVYLISIHGLMLAMLINLLSYFWLSFAVFLLTASLSYYCRRYQWLDSSYACTQLGYDNKGQWILRYSDSSLQDKLSLKHCVVTSRFVIVYFAGTSQWREKSITIVVDAVDIELFRQLRVYLRSPKTFQR